jgi:hypothetical protein
MTCPQCGAEHSPEQGRFCASCGLPVAEAAPMTCPHCGAPYSAEQGRFCEACGLAIPATPRRAAPPAGPAAPAPASKREAYGDEDLLRCRSCGTRTAAPVCPGCGNRMPEPER